MKLELKPFAFIDIEEAMEFLKIPTNKQDENRNKVIRLINAACKRVESYIDRPVIEREFVEYQDGTAANIIVPTYAPIREIVEIKIDFNRAFKIADAFSKDNFVLVGIPDKDQQAYEKIEQGNYEPLYKIEGSHIVIRDDNNTAVFGRLFSGSIIQSIKVTYKAGYASSAADVPDDLKYATLMLMDHLYMANENRDVKHTSKSSNGQTYNKETGWPQEIVDMLDEYKDYSFGPLGRPQKNTFTL